jgi:hypothetical protein
MEENEGREGLETEETPEGTDADTATGEDGNEAGDTEGRESDNEKKDADKGEGEKEELPTITETALQRRLAREQRKHERQLQEARERLNARIEALEAKVRPIVNPKPKVEDFESHDKYVEALVDWNILNRDGGQKAERQNAKEGRNAEDDSSSLQDAIEDMVSAGKTKYRDWDTVVVTSYDDLPITPVMAVAMAETDCGEDIAYFLGKNPNEAKRISKLSGVKQTVEIGRLTSLFNKGVNQNNKRQIQTIKPVGSGAKAPSGDKDPAKMSYHEYKKWRASGGGRQ